MTYFGLPQEKKNMPTGVTNSQKLIIMSSMKFFLAVFILINMTSCKSSRMVANSKNGEVENAIETAIMNFSKIKKLYKNDSVFSVSLYNMPENENLVVVEIARNNTKLLLTKDIKVGKKVSKFPTKYLEKEGKLFFWWNDSTILTSEALSVFERYSLLQDDDNGRRRTPSFIINETKKGAHYFFCRKDFSIYKRVITNIGFGYYKPPLLKCGGE